MLDKQKVDALRNYLKDGFTAEAVPNAFDQITIYFDINGLKTIKEAGRTLGEGFGWHNYDVDDLVDPDTNMPEAVSVDYAVNDWVDTPEGQTHALTDQTFKELTSNPHILGIFAHRRDDPVSKKTVLFVREGFECPDHFLEHQNNLYASIFAPNGGN